MAGPHLPTRQGQGGFREEEVQSLCPAMMRASVHEAVDVVVEADRRAGGPAVCTAVCTAAAALDPHDVSVEVLPIGAVEAELHSAGEGGCATAAISASATGARAVPLCRRASGKHNSDRFLGPDASLTLPSLLASYRRVRLTVSDLTQSGFPDQLTVWVVTCHST